MTKNDSSGRPSGWGDGAARSKAPMTSTPMSDQELLRTAAVQVATAVRNLSSEIIKKNDLLTLSDRIVLDLAMANAQTWLDLAARQLLEVQLRGLPHRKEKTP